MESKIIYTLMRMTTDVDALMGVTVDKTTAGDWERSDEEHYYRTWVWQELAGEYKEKG